jgi:hypothetical protein
VTSALAALLLLAAPALHLGTGARADADKGLPCPGHAALSGALGQLIAGIRIEEGPVIEGDLVARLSRERGRWQLLVKQADGSVALRRSLDLPAKECALLGRTAALVIDRYLEDVRWPGRPPKLQPLPQPEPSGEPSPPPLPVEPGAGPRQGQTAMVLPPVPERPPPPSQEKAAAGPDRASAGGMSASAGRTAATTVEVEPPLPELRPVQKAEKGAQEAGSAKQETAGSKQETAGSKQETAGTKQETAGPKQETAGTKQETAGPKQETAGAKQETAGTKQETAGTKQETAGTKQETAGPKQETAEQAPPVPLDAARPPPEPWHLGLQAGPGLYWGTPDELRGALSLGGQLRRGPWQLGLSLWGTGSSGQDVVSSGLVRGQTQVRALAAAFSVELCAAVRSWRFCGGPSLGGRLSLGTLSGAQILQTGSAAILQSAAGAHAAVGYRLNERLELSLDAQALAPLGSARFDVAGAPSRALPGLDLAWALRLGWLVF